MQLAFKLTISEYAEKSIEGVGRKISISENSVHDWRRQKEKLLTLPNKQRLLSGGGRRPLLPYEEGQLHGRFDRRNMQSTSQSYKIRHPAQGPKNFIKGLTLHQPGGGLRSS